MAKRLNGKSKLGPGGIKCPCCTKGDFQFHKELSKKQERREIREETRKQKCEACDQPVIGFFYGHGYCQECLDESIEMDDEGIDNVG